MTTSKALTSYEDIRTAADRALESENGVRIKIGHNGRAINIQQRFYSFRLADRRKSREIYEPAHPMHDSSPYDILTCRVEDGDVFIRRPPPLELEDL